MLVFPKILNGVHLKLIASICMLADHICAIFFPASSAAFAVRLSVGRIAMPVYIFLICEGFFHTRSRRRYAISLLVTAIFSEPIYDVALHGYLGNFNYQNVCFTLLCGFAMLCALNKPALSQKTYLQLPVIAAFSIGTYFLNLSYDYSAMLTFAVFYYLYFRKSAVRGICASATLAVLENTPGALLAALPIGFYNNERGRIGTLGKYLFYAFYPGHLLILFVIKSCI